jgi:DNA-binding Xre family transcriptional regulator
MPWKDVVWNHEKGGNVDHITDNGLSIWDVEYVAGGLAMADRKLNRIVRKATPAEKRRHELIRLETDNEFANRRRPVSASRVILAKLRSQRELKGLSLADVARRMGVARSNLCRLEQNGENVKLETLNRYAAAVGYELSIDIRELAST